MPVRALAGNIVLCSWVGQFTLAVPFSTAGVQIGEQLHNTGPLLKVHNFSGSFDSAVDERTRNNLYMR